VTKPGFCPRSGLFRSGADGPGLRSGAEGPSAGPATRSGAPEDKATSRTKRQATGRKIENGANPDTRFLNLFGPGPLITNPFCKDECFNDSDCVGNLKCCLSSCRQCTNPSFGGFGGGFGSGFGKK